MPWSANHSPTRAGRRAMAHTSDASVSRVPRPPRASASSATVNVASRSAGSGGWSLQLSGGSSGQPHPGNAAPTETASTPRRASHAATGPPRSNRAVSNRPSTEQAGAEPRPGATSRGRPTSPCAGSAAPWTALRRPREVAGREQRVGDRARCAIRRVWRRGPRDGGRRPRLVRQASAAGGLFWNSEQWKSAQRES